MLELDTFYYEDYELITGIDEAGRGPLAGPLVVASVTVKKNFSLTKLNDSKKLSDKVRRILFDKIKEEAEEFHIIVISVEDIDLLNILKATMLGITKVFQEVSHPGKVLVDGNRLPEELFNTNSEAIVKGDQKVSAIAAASVLAKVFRDNIMLELDKQHPEYGFCRNKGYGTLEHIKAINQHGITTHHRKSFGPVAQQTIIFN